MKQPIRVLHVVTIMNLGGIETFLMTLYRNIDRSKIQFDFLVHRSEKGFFDDEIKELGGRIHVVQSLNPKRVVSYCRELSSLFKKNKEYSIVHSHLNANSSLVLWIAKKNKIKNRIAHSHTDQASGKKYYLKNILRKYINQVSTARFACSQQAGTWLFKDADFEVFKNSIDSKRFKFSLEKRENIRDVLKISADSILIGNIAGFSKPKNHLFMIDVFNQYIKIRPDSKLILVGDGGMFKEVRDKVNNLRLADSVIFTGAVVNANDYLNAMDLFLFPSLFEGLGIVAIEAQCNGLPVLMTDTLPEDVEVTNLITRLNLNLCPKAWAHRINFLVSSKNNREGFEKLILDKGYDIYENAKKITNYYLSLN